jgi:hypothetical protein
MSPAAGMGGELARLANETADAARDLMAVNKQAAAWYAARIGWIARSLEARLEERPEPAPELEIRMVPERGVTLDRVWVPERILNRLARADPGGYRIRGLDPDQERVLTAHGLAVKDVGGLVRGPDLPGFLATLEMPR